MQNDPLAAHRPHHPPGSDVRLFRVPSDMLAGAFLGSLIGALGVILAYADRTGLIVTGALVLGILGIVHGSRTARQ